MEGFTLFKSIKLKIIKGRKLLPFATAKVLQNHDDRIDALEKGVDPDGVSIEDINDAELVEMVVTYTDDSTETIKVVAQTPSNP